MLYGERFVDNDELKKWVNSWCIKEREEEWIKQYFESSFEETKSYLNKQILLIQEFVNNLKEDDDWRSMQGICSRYIYELFFKVNDYSIKVGNFYECFIIPCDIETKKKIIAGFDYKDIGRVNILKDKNLIGSIGEKSDLIWSVFYDDFIIEDEFGIITHVLDHEVYLTLQFWSEYDESDEGIKNYIDYLLMKSSTELGMNFRVVTVPKEAKRVGMDNTFEIEVDVENYENIPLIYFNNGFQTQDFRLSFLSYYQVLEYFFIRAQNNSLINGLMNDGTTDINNISHINLRKALKQYNNSTREKASLKLVLNEVVNVDKLKLWINENPQRINHYTIDSLDDYSIALDLSKTNDKIVSKLAERIYFFRCAIAHAKGDTDDYLVIPNFNDNIIVDEIELMKFVAASALENY